MQPVALIRPPTSDFVRCVTGTPVTPPLDPVLAADQHEVYRAALEMGGFTVWDVESPEGHPDAPFIEDTAVIVGERALVTRPGHESRRGETDSVAAVLSDLVDVTRVVSPATIDGGDVLQVAGRIFVGRSKRTNQAGIEALAQFASPVPAVPVDVMGVLHLKSAVTALDDRTLLMMRGMVDETPFAGLRIIDVPGDNPEVANVVKLPDGRILVGSAASADIVTAAGFEPVVVDVSEFGRAGGGLTCLSVRFRDVFVAETP